MQPDYTNAAFAARIMRTRKDGASEEAWFAAAVTRRASLSLGDAALFGAPQEAAEAVTQHGYRLVSVVMVAAVAQVGA